MSSDFSVWGAINALRATNAFFARQYNRRKSLIFSKPEHEHELPQSNIDIADEAAAVERERKRRDEDEQRA